MCDYVTLIIVSWFLAVSIILIYVDGANILAFFPLPARSHNAVYEPIIRQLAAKGHQVTFYTAFPFESPLASLKIVPVPENLRSLSRTKDASQPFYNTMPSSAFGKVMAFHEIGLPIQENLMEEDVVQQLYKTNEKFDIVLTAYLFAFPCFASLKHKFNTSIINIIPVGDTSRILQATGSPENPAYMVDVFSEYSEQMTFVERVYNTLNWGFIRIVNYYYNTLPTQAMMDKYLIYPGWQSRPPLMSMLGDSALVLLNSHHSLGYSYPKAPHFKEIGGVNIVDSKPLPKDLKEFLDSAPNGAVYFSLGSIISSSDIAVGAARKAFLNVFEKLNVKVLWKIDAEDLPDKSSNVMVSKWFPQQDVLGHKNIKAFITQGGMMSMFEAVSRGVPLLGIPVFGDQFKNMKLASYKGFGIQLDRNNLTEQSIHWALNLLLNDTSYKKSAESRAKIFHDRIQKPVDEAVYWIEYVLKHGEVLQPASVKLPFYQLYQLDVLFVIILSAVFSVKLLTHMCRLCVNLCSKKWVKPEKIKHN